MSNGHGTFLNDDDSLTIAAFAERLMRAWQASAMPECSITSTWRSPAPMPVSEDFYRRGLAALDAYSRKTFNAPFRGLSAAAG